MQLRDWRTGEVVRTVTIEKRAVLEGALRAEVAAWEDGLLRWMTRTGGGWVAEDGSTVATHDWSADHTPVFATDGAAYVLRDGDCPDLTLERWTAEGRQWTRTVEGIANPHTCNGPVLYTAADGGVLVSSHDRGLAGFGADGTSWTYAPPEDEAGHHVKVVPTVDGHVLVFSTSDTHGVGGDIGGPPDCHDCWLHHRLLDASTGALVHQWVHDRFQDQRSVEMPTVRGGRLYYFDDIADEYVARDLPVEVGDALWIHDATTWPHGGETDLASYCPTQDPDAPDGAPDDEAELAAYWSVQCHRLVGLLDQLTESYPYAASDLAGWLRTNLPAGERPSADTMAGLDRFIGLANVIESTAAPRMYLTELMSLAYEQAMADVRSWALSTVVTVPGQRQALGDAAAALPTSPFRLLTGTTVADLQENLFDVGVGTVAGPTVNVVDDLVGGPVDLTTHRPMMGYLDEFFDGFLQTGFTNALRWQGAFPDQGTVNAAMAHAQRRLDHAVELVSQELAAYGVEQALLLGGPHTRPILRTLVDVASLAFIPAKVGLEVLDAGRTFVYAPLLVGQANYASAVLADMLPTDVEDAAEQLGLGLESTTTTSSSSSARTLSAVSDGLSEPTSVLVAGPVEVQLDGATVGRDTAMTTVVDGALTQMLFNGDGHDVVLTGRDGGGEVTATIHNRGVESVATVELTLADGEQAVLGRDQDWHPADQRTVDDATRRVLAAAEAADDDTPGDDDASEQPTPPADEGPDGPTSPTSGRLEGVSRFDTAVSISREQFPEGASRVFLARGVDPLVDAVAAGSLTAGPILLVPPCGEVPSVVLEEVERLDPSRVVAIGGPAAVCDEVLLSTIDLAG